MKVLKILCIFEIILVCPVTFKPLKMGGGEEMYKKIEAILQQ